MQALQEELYNEDWTFIFPNMSQIYQINIFDDGNEKYQEYNNKWIIFGEWKEKVAIFNYYAPEIIIKSISKWKIKN
jgi:hypothetical protein